MNEASNDDDYYDDESDAPEEQSFEIETIPSEWLQIDRLWSFDDIVGQAQIREALRKRAIEQPYGDHIILHGPPGVGKRALSLLYGQAIQCIAIKSDGAPCRVCGPCVDFAGAGRLTRDQALSRLVKACHNLGVEYDSPALDVIAAQAGFHAGLLIHRLWDVYREGEVTLESARLAFRLEWSEDILSIWKAVLAGDRDLVRAELQS